MDDTLHDASPLGGGKRDAGVVVTAAPAHPPPRSLAQRGVGNVRLPSTLSHSVYSGRAAARLVMLRVATEELMPEAPLLVIPNGGSVPRCVDELRKAGFLSAVALNQALGVLPADEGDAAQGGAGREAGRGAGSAWETRGRDCQSFPKRARDSPRCRVQRPAAPLREATPAGQISATSRLNRGQISAASRRDLGT